MWKQPIPTNLETVFGEDYRAIQLYKEIVYRACNADCRLSLDGRKFVTLKRGQVLFGRNRYAQYLGWQPSTVDKCLKRVFGVMQSNNQMTKQANNDYTVITINNYDDVVSMNNQSSNQSNKLVATWEQPSSTSKSIKSDKSDKKRMPTVTLQENYSSSTVGSLGKKAEPIKGSSICVFIEKFNELFGKNYEVTDKRTKYLSQRLKRFPLEKILTSLDNLASSDFHRGKNDRNWVADPDFLIRSDEQVDKFLNLSSKKKVLNSNLPI